MTDRPPIDLRSDTVTRPTPAMLEAMVGAALGDDVLGDDPTVNALESEVARLLGKDEACFVPSGTMANQTAIRAQTEPGDEIIAHGDSHVIHYETGAPAALSGCGVCPLTGPAGLFDPADVAAAVRADATWLPRSRLLLLENTQNRGGGSVWPVDRFAAVCAEGRRHGLRVHLDGARLFNACAAAGCEPRVYADEVDTVAICFSKGLGAPAGSAVAGDAETIGRVRRIRKMLGGAMRQSGLLAEACRYALRHHVRRLADDHANARRFAHGVIEVDGLRLDLETVQSNMVFFDVDPVLATGAALSDRLRAAGVLILPMGPQRLRAVMHLDVDANDVDRAIRTLRAVCGA